MILVNDIGDASSSSPAEPGQATFGRSAVSAVKAVLLSVKMHTEIYTVGRRRYAKTQTRSPLISLTIKVAIGAPDPSS